MDKLIISFTPTGMVPTKEMTERVPIAEQEIIEQVLAANEVGITMLHLHARDENGVPTYKRDVYGRLIEGIRKYAPTLIICVSLSGRNFNEFEKRSDPLNLDGNLKPDMGSLTLSSLNFNKQGSMNTPSMVKALASKMQELGIAPELEAFDLGMVNFANYLAKRGFLSPPHYFNLFFGNIATAQLDLSHMGIMINDLPQDSYWSFGGIGDAQLPANMIAIAMGGGLRVGLEDNIFFDRRRTLLASNLDLIQRLHGLAATFEREVMPSSECRKLLNLKGGSGEYGKA